MYLAKVEIEGRNDDTYNVLPRITYTPMVFWSTYSIAFFGSRRNLLSSLTGTSLHSTSKYRANFSRATWAFAPMTILGLIQMLTEAKGRTEKHYPGSWILIPAALRLCCHNFFMASPPSCIASEEPVVAVPTACFADGACHIPARIEIPSIN